MFNQGLAGGGSQRRAVLILLGLMTEPQRNRSRSRHFIFFFHWDFLWGFQGSGKESGLQRKNQGKKEKKPRGE